MAKQCRNVPATAQHAKNQHVFVLGTVDDAVLADRKTPQARAQIFITGAAQIGVAGEKIEPLSDGINETVGNVETAAPGRKRSAKCRRGRNLLSASGGVPSMRRVLLGGKSATPALLYLLGQLAHGLLRDDAPFAARKRSLRLIDRGKDFRSAALPVLPQGKRFFHRVFLNAEASALNGLADKRLLVWRELHFHRLKRRRGESRCQAQELCIGASAGSADRFLTVWPTLVESPSPAPCPDPLSPPRRAARLRPARLPSAPADRSGIAAK